MARLSSSSTALGWNKLVLLTAMLACAGEVCAVPTNSQHYDVEEGQSIQEAIHKASHGDEIRVGPGTYPEQLTIDKDGISLVGSGSILVPPSIPFNNTCTGLAGNDTQAGICVTGYEVELAPYLFDHRKVLSVGRYVKDVYITGFEVHGFTGENIAVVGGKDTVVSKNTLVNGDQYGFLTAGSVNTLATYNNITTDVIRYIGMCMDDLSDAEFSSNEITGYYIGLCVQTKGAVLKQNRVKSTCVGAFVDPGVHEANLIENHIGPSNPDCPGEGPRGGINIYGASYTVVVKNLIEGQKNHNSSAGIVLLDDTTTPDLFVAEGNIIKKNIFRDNDFDIFVNSTSTENVVEDNTCSAPGPGCA